MYDSWQLSHAHLYTPELRYFFIYLYVFIDFRFLGLISQCKYLYVPTFIFISRNNTDDELLICSKRLFFK